MRTLTLALIAVALLAAGIREAAAHHSFAPFNLEAEQTISGTIKRFDWTNPHTWIWVDVTGDNGKVETWGIEGMSPNFLARRGWSRTTLKSGGTITVSYRPMRDGSKGGMFINGKMATGKVLTMGGAGEGEPAK